MFPDGFHLAAPGAAVAEPELVQAKLDARQELREARRDLRHERAEANPDPNQLIRKRAALREARQDFREARRELRQARSGGFAEDTFTAAPARQGPAPVAVDPAQQHPGNGLALGKTLPNISQLHPAGAENGGYTNGDMNCGPAAMAMISRGQMNRMLDGKPVKGMTDSELIMRLGAHGQTDAEGTSPNGIVAMGEALGMQTSSRQGGLDTQYYDSVLAQGGSVVANGALERDGQLFGHYVTVSGKDAQGLYVVNDPWTNKTFHWSASQLDAFLRSNPVNGGWSIGVI
jgi:hypothetical protein